MTRAAAALDRAKIRALILAGALGTISGETLSALETLRLPSESVDVDLEAYAGSLAEASEALDLLMSEAEELATILDRLTGDAEEDVAAAHTARALSSQLPAPSSKLIAHS